MKLLRPLTYLFTAACLFGPALASAQVASCPTLPKHGCNRGDSGLLQLQGTGTPLTWTLGNGDATALVDFGDPSLTTGYAVCAYTGTHSNLMFEASIPADESSWSTLGAPSSGWQFSNSITPPDGIEQISLMAGPQGQASVSVTGAGGSLPALPFSPDYPVRFQLINSDTDVCWEDSFDGTDIQTDAADQLHLVSGPEDPNAQLAVSRKRKPMNRLSAAEAGVPAFVGAPAIANPIPALVIPDNPFLNNDGDSRIHNDHYSSAVYNRPGPLATNPLFLHSDLKVLPDDISNICAMLAFSEDGYPIGACFQFGFTEGGSARLTMLHPVKLDILAEVATAPRGFEQGPGGGAYFSILEDGRILVGPPTNAVEIWAAEVNGGKASFVRYASFDVSAELLPGGLLPDTIVDYEGRLWWVATSGEIGYVDPDTGLVYASTTGEELQNSLSVDATGVYVVTSQSMQKFSVDINGAVQQEWRTPYDNSGPGILQPGSGTTPTLFGTLDDLVGIADTALSQVDPTKSHVNAMVYRRSDGSEVCKIPLFRAGESGAENTFIGYNDDLVVVNNGGFPGPFGPQREIYPGIERHRVLADRNAGCEPVWINHDSFANSAQLSTSTGIIYGWGPDPDVPDLDAYYFTGTDWETGGEIFRKYVGNGNPFNPVTGQMHIGPDGSAYIGTFAGVTRIWDAPPPGGGCF